MDIALSPTEVADLHARLVGAPLTVYEYDHVIRAPTLDTLFTGSADAVVIFYPAVEVGNLTVGHYCALLRHPDTRTFSFYDPLAYRPDEYKQFAYERQRLYPEQQNSLVRHLLSKALDGWTVDWNDHQHQSRRPDVATCGYHCVLRAMAAALSNDEYDDALNAVAHAMGTSDKFCDSLVLFLTA